MSSEQVGVLVMAHGTPATPADIEPFYTSIRRGHPPTPELLAELVGRYEAIGGTSPLAVRTHDQVAGIARALEALSPGRFVVRYGAKHTVPSIEEAAGELVATGVGRVVGLVLTPHQSSLGAGQYLERAAAALSGASSSGAPRPPVVFTPVASWHRAPGLAELLAERTAATLAGLGVVPEPGGAPSRTAVLFTAHSLPERVVAAGDPYPDQVGESAADIATVLDLDRWPGVSWGVGWQSAGRTADAWIGPDLLGELERLAEDGVDTVVVCPVGFVADHLEVLYDLDVEAAQAARRFGLRFARTASLNAAPAFVELLARVVVTAASDSPEER
ncbi:MAG: ferrochelatase [Acidimicrobiales bacterium]